MYTKQFAQSPMWECRGFVTGMVIINELGVSDSIDQHKVKSTRNHRQYQGQAA